MATFKIAGNITVSCWTEVEAESEEQALEIAGKRHVAEFHVDGSFPESASWHMDTDGSPYNMRIES
jgi:hypothetical protein